MTDENIAAAERDATNQAPTMDVGGRMVVFRPKLPIGMASAAQRGDVDLMVEILATGSVFADPQPDDPPMKRWLELNLVDTDFNKVAELYGLTMGESAASD